MEYSRRLPEGTWQVTLHQAMEAVIELKSIGVPIPAAIVHEALDGYSPGETCDA
ncbi:MAG: hypothetical protein JNM66_28170 [Bryobacterales bacterium]|nr:hypothetical protein [Bryobacterales bacterium]